MVHKSDISFKNCFYKNYSKSYYNKKYKKKRKNKTHSLGLVVGRRLDEGPAVAQRRAAVPGDDHALPGVLPPLLRRGAGRRGGRAPSPAYRPRAPPCGGTRADRHGGGGPVRREAVLLRGKSLLLLLGRRSGKSLVEGRRRKSGSGEKLRLEGGRRSGRALLS